MTDTLTAYLRVSFIADATSIPMNPAPMIVIFLTPVYLIESLIFSKSLMFLRSLNFVYLRPGIGGNLLTHPVAIKSLS